MKKSTSLFFILMSMPLLTSAQGMMGSWSDDYWYDSPYMMGFGFGVSGLIFMMLIWILIITGIVFLIRWLLRQNKLSQVGGDSALDLLKERYARGEIDKQEFEEKKKDLAG